jgi:hypothetical protein
MPPRVVTAVDAPAQRHIASLITATETSSEVDPSVVDLGDEPHKILPQLRLFARLRAKQLSARFLRLARCRAGFNQTELGERLGLKTGYVPQCENASLDAKVPIDYLIQVALITKMPLYLGEFTDLTPAQLLERIRALEEENKELRVRLAAETELNDAIMRRNR